MTDTLQGNDCLFQINTTGSFKNLVCSKSFTLTVETETKETTTRGDGGWRDYDYKTIGYTITLSGLLKLVDSSGRNTYNDLFQQQINFLEVPYRVIYTDASGNNSIIIGTVIITRTTLNTPAGSNVESDIELIGKGNFSLFEITETNTVDFNLDSSNFGSDNNLSDGTNTYRLSDYKVLLTTNETSSQQVSVNFRVPWIGNGPDINNDYLYSAFSSTGIEDVILSGTTDGFFWYATATFNFINSTSNKLISIFSQ
jgi:hypothetical protein